MKKTIQTLINDGFILVFNQDRLDVVKTAQAVMAAGVNNMEVTCRISNPLEKISRLKKELPGFLIGAASLVDFPAVLNVYNNDHSDDPIPTVDQVIDAGAGYIVSAVNFSRETYDKHRGKVAIIPGCGSADEIVREYSKGANMCKLFPAKQAGGPGYIKAVDPALHKIISIVPTGGTNTDNIPDYIAAGVLTLGGSFSLIEKAVLQKIIDKQDYDTLADELKKVKQLIDDCRSKQYPSLDITKASIEEISRVTGRNFNL